MHLRRLAIVEVESPGSGYVTSSKIVCCSITELVVVGCASSLYSPVCPMWFTCSGGSLILVFISLVTLVCWAVCRAFGSMSDGCWWGTTFEW
jgi:hypothetical protein